MQKPIRHYAGISWSEMAGDASSVVRDPNSRSITSSAVASKATILIATSSHFALNATEPFTVDLRRVGRVVGDDVVQAADQRRTRK